MRRADIHLGETYTDGRGALRRVVALSGEGDAARVTYEIVQHRRNAHGAVGTHHPMSARAFRAWAVRPAPLPESTP